MTRKKSAAFTLMEVMLAVAILALTASASLKLAVLAQNGLRAAKEKEDFLAAAQKIRAEILTGKADENGSAGNLRWNTSEKEKEFFGENFGKLDFSRKNDEPKPETNIKWRELEIENKAADKKMTIVLPQKN